MQSARKLIGFLRPYWRWALLAPLMMAIEVAMDLMQPRLLQRIIDRGVARHDLPFVLHTGAWMIGLALIGTAGGILCTLFAVRAAQGFGTDLRRALFDKIQAFSFSDLDSLETGALITRLTNDVTQVQQLAMILLRIMVRAPLIMVGSLIMAILTSPQLSLLFVVLIPVVMVAVVLIVNRSYPMFIQVQKRLDALNTVFQENLAGVRVVKAFARAAHEIGRFATANNSLMEQNITVVRLSALTMPVMMVTLNAGVVAALWFGGARVGAGTLQIGQVVAFLNYLGQTLMSLLFVSMLVIQVSRAEASASRVREVLTREPGLITPPDPLSIAAPHGRVAFENVTFRYDRDDRDPVLQGISFVAEPGETIAILGATGSGKSSLVGLIPRFYDVSEGRITLDGTDVRRLSASALRAAVGIALQESRLFSGTIRDNIRFGRLDATEAEVIAVAQAAQAHDFITAQPEGYDAIVGQQGVNLSGGQKQRIAIARALLVQPAILILDDSTSAVDVQTEARIQAALATLHPGQTRFIVAQRISAVRNADKILVLDDGRLVGEGRHEDLLESNPLYREIYESQQENGVIADGSE
jgi:ATP-binding cassette subfamily B multidrug efflux pump